VVGLELTMAERQTHAPLAGETSVQTGTSPEW
jgi:hypothetical protein